jgi:hypothetical protein
MKAIKQFCMALMVLLFLLQTAPSPKSALLLAMNNKSEQAQQSVKNNAGAETKGPGSYKILNKKSGPVRIPFTMHLGKPVIKLKINGKKASLMIDNGRLWNQVWLYGSPLVDKLALNREDTTFIHGGGEGDSTKAFNSNSLTLTLQNIEFYDQPVLASQASEGFAKMFPGVDGQLSNTFFRHFIVEFDFIKNEILLHDPKTFQYTENGSVLDMQGDDNEGYSVPFAFTMPDGKEFHDRIDIDFGGIYPLKIALNNKNNIQPPPDAKPTASRGAQGRSSEYRAKIKNMTIGKYQFDNPTAIFGDEKTARIHPGNLGVIGLPLFMKFNTTFDYFNYKLYLTPDKNFNTSFKE